jgi:hypothetical protein
LLEKQSTHISHRREHIYSTAEIQESIQALRDVVLVPGLLFALGGIHSFTLLSAKRKLPHHVVVGCREGASPHFNHAVGPDKPSCDLQSICIEGLVKVGSLPDHWKGMKLLSTSWFIWELVDLLVDFVLPPIVNFGPNYIGERSLTSVSVSFQIVHPDSFIVFVVHLALALEDVTDLTDVISEALTDSRSFVLDPAKTADGRIP